MIISMINRTAGAGWVVRLGVTRSGGWRDWGTVSGQFERHLAAQASERILEPHIESESRRGSDHVRITVLMNVRAADVAEALSAAWWAFRKAADDGWDLSSAVADVRPGAIALFAGGGWGWNWTICLVTRCPGLHRPASANRTARAEEGQALFGNEAHY